MIDENEFLTNFEAQFDDLQPNSMALDTPFRDAEGWGSLVGLSIIAMIDESYDLIISADELKQCQTPQDVLNIIQSKR